MNWGQDQPVDESLSCVRGGESDGGVCNSCGLVNHCVPLAIQSGGMIETYFQWFSICFKCGLATIHTLCALESLLYHSPVLVRMYIDTKCRLEMYISFYYEI